MGKIKDTNVDKAPTVSGITAILSHSKGFACSVGPGTVCLFEKMEEDSYRKSREIQVNLNATDNIHSAGFLNVVMILCVFFSVRFHQTNTLMR